MGSLMSFLVSITVTKLPAMSDVTAQLVLFGAGAVTGILVSYIVRAISAILEARRWR